MNTLFPDYFLNFKNVPEKWESAQAKLNEYFTQLTNYLNSKSSGIYTSAVSPSGKQLFVTSQTYDVQRLTLRFGALPAAGTKSVAHGLDTSLGFRIFNLYLAASDTSSETYFCLKYWSDSAGDIKINMDMTNVNVEVSSDYSNFDDSYVIIEFVQGVTI